MNPLTGDWVFKFDLQLLGGFRLTGPKAKPIAISGRKAQALLAYLALNSGAQPREKLATLLWGDRMDEQARHSLRQALSSLRKALGDGKTDPLAADGETLELEPGALAVDALAFTEAAAKSSLEALMQAAALYTGPLLDGVRFDSEGFDNWLAGERERLHALACGVLEKLAAHQELAGEPENATATAKRLLSLDAAREEGHRLLMRLYAAAGRRADALRQYQACADALRRELDTEPSAETMGLYEAIRVGDGSPVEKSSPPEVSTGSALSGEPPPLPDKPSIAVLPFENMSGDPEQEYFSDGLSEDIITDLSKIGGLSVTARQSSFSYKGKSAMATQIGRELGVGHIIEGSVRKAGNRVRITAQLVETETGRQIWAERYDRTLEDLFAVQDEITGEVVTALDVNLMEGEQAREWRTSTASPEAYFLHLQARNEWLRFQGRRTVVRARQLWEMALEKDPNFSRAFAALGGSYLCEVIWGFSQDVESSLKQSIEYIHRAIRLENRSSYAYSCKALYHLYQMEHDQALSEGERAISLNPLGADVTFFLAWVQVFSGMPKNALESIRKGKELTPDTPAWFLTDQGHAEILLGQYKNALEPMIVSTQLAPDLLITHVLLAGVHAALGQERERQAEVNEVLRLDHGFSVEEWSARELPYRNPEDLERMMALLRQAGLPD